MGGSITQIALYVVGAGVFGVVTGWLIRGANSKRRIGQLTGNGNEQARLDDVTRQRDQFAAEYSKLRSTAETLQAAVAKGRIELESAVEKAKLLAKNVLTLRAEREDTKIKVSTIQNALVLVNKQTVALQTEFVKAGEFYKGELVKSFEKRKVLEEKLENARKEQESFTDLLESSFSEHGSADKMIAATKIRLARLDVLERNYEKLEAENAQLSDEATRTKQEYEALKREVAELEELRIHNQQLVHCVESLESSRKQHEDDAEKYRDSAEQSEQLSDTLRLKLNDIEKNFADIEKQQHQALQDARKTSVVPSSSAKKSPPKEVDDLQKIVGVGKVFEQALNELGIFSFRQIAEFNVGDMARVNKELKEFKGRIEQDDWIGQAKELHLRKYSETE